MPLETQVTATIETPLGKVTELRFRGYDREWITGRPALPTHVQNPPVVIDGPHDMPAQTAEHALRFLAEKL